MAVDVDWTLVEEVADLDKIYKKAIAKAEDDEEAAIRAEWSERKAEFWERRASAAALDVAKRNALDKYPLAKEFAEDIRGGSAAEIEAQAKRFHERMEKASKAADEAEAARVKAEADAKAAAQQQYGQPVGAGGGTPSRPALEDNEALKQRVRDKLARGEGLQRAGDRMDSTRFQNLRFAEGVEAAITNPSYRSFSRMAPDDKKIQDDRTKRKTG